MPLKSDAQNKTANLPPMTVTGLRNRPDICTPTSPEQYYFSLLALATSGCVNDTPQAMYARPPISFVPCCGLTAANNG